MRIEMESNNSNVSEAVIPADYQVLNKKLSKKTLIAYGCGDFASNLCWTFIGSYLSVFYTDVVGLTPVIASTILLVAKIWDAFNDPMFGAVAERTNTKKGRFRPYIYYGTPNKAVYDALDDETKEDYTIFPEEATLNKCEVYKYLGEKTDQYYNRLWKELKSY